MRCLSIQIANEKAKSYYVDYTKIGENNFVYHEFVHRTNEFDYATAAKLIKPRNTIGLQSAINSCFH